MKIKNLSDRECLDLFIKMLEKRVSIETAFVREIDTGRFTHQVLKVSCGDLMTVSEPEELEWPLQLAGLDDDFKEKYKDKIN